MNEDDANESLLVLIGELLYKNQLLREAIASKDELIELIINHLMTVTSACSCGIANQLTFVRNVVKERDVELARRKRYCFNEVCNIVKRPIDSAADFPLGRGDQTCRKIEVDPYDFRGFCKRMRVLR